MPEMEDPELLDHRREHIPLNASLIMEEDTFPCHPRKHCRNTVRGEKSISLKSLHSRYRGE